MDQGYLSIKSICEHIKESADKTFTNQEFGILHIKHAAKEVANFSSKYWNYVLPLDEQEIKRLQNLAVAIYIAEIGRVNDEYCLCLYDALG